MPTEEWRERPWPRGLRCSGVAAAQQHGEGSAGTGRGCGRRAETPRRLAAGEQGVTACLVGGWMPAGGARDAPCGAGCSESCARAARPGCRSVCPSAGPEAWPALGWSVKPWGALRGAGDFSPLRLALCVHSTRPSGRINSHGTNSCRAIYPKNTGDFSCSRMINHTPVAAVSLIIFSQYLSVCFCIKHEVKQEVGSSFSFLL